MGLTEKERKEILEELDNCQRPLFFFDDDPDGLVSFLLLYRYKKEGSSVVVKSDPRIDAKFIRKVEEYEPDKIFVLDTAMMDDEFVKAVKRPIIWIDHHAPQRVEGTKYYNPKSRDREDPAVTSELCYEVVQQDLWIAMCGIVGDWRFPDKLAREFREEFPDLLPESIKTAPDALFNTRLGELIRIFSFILKGKTMDAKRCARILTRIKSPYEILDRKTPAGRFLYKRYQSVNEEYSSLLADAVGKASEDPLLLFEYTSSSMSFTGDLSNELLYRFPDKLIIIAREKSGEMKCSARSAKHDLPKAIAKSLSGLQGRGGGHKGACGIVVKKEDFSEFIANLRKELNL